MADFPIYRLVKGSTLTFTEMDDNLRWLSANMSASVVTITGSTYVLGNLNVSDGITGSLFGTSSWALNVATASYAINAVSSSYPIAVTGSTLYSTSPKAGIPSGTSTQRSIFLGVDAGFSASNAADSNFIGYQAGYSASEAYSSNFIGYQAGYNAVYATFANFLGIGAGYNATYATECNMFGSNAGTNAGYTVNSNFLGYLAGYNAYTSSYSNFLGNEAGMSCYNATHSNFLGYRAGKFSQNGNNSNFLGNSAGYEATNANNSNFLGNSAGNGAANAAYSTLLGYNTGKKITFPGIGSNNIIIGTNITLPNETKDSINLGAIIFATGSYSTTVGNPFLGTSNGRVGINQPTPIFNLDVSGSGRYTNGLTISGSITGSNALLTGTLIVQTIVAQTITSSTDFVTGSTRFGSLVSDTHQFTGSVLAPSITGSLQGTSSWAVSASWAPSPVVTTVSSYIATGSVSASVNVGNRAFNLVSSSNNLVTILSNGNVGIGTTTPSQSLDVNGRIRVGSNPQTEIYSGANRLVFRGDNVDNVAQMTAYGIFLPIENQTYNLYQAGSTLLGYTDTTASLDIARGGSGATVYVRLNSNGHSYLNGGNVGIGTTTPTAALTVSGSISGSGAVYFKGLTTANQSNVVTVDTASGQLYYTASSAIGGGATESGTYTPTLTAVYNVASIDAAYELQYMRVGNVVTVGGYLSANATATNTWTRISISLPISSTFDFSYRAGGGGGSGASNNFCSIQAAAFQTNLVYLDSYPNTTLNIGYAFSFTYLIM
jgi:hypothetical protein